MSSASIFVSRMTSAPPPPPAPEASDGANAWRVSGATSRWQALQRPVAAALDRRSGRRAAAMIEPTSSPSPVNSNDVT